MAGTGRRGRQLLTPPTGPTELPPAERSEGSGHPEGLRLGDGAESPTTQPLGRTARRRAGHARLLTRVSNAAAAVPVDCTSSSHSRTPTSVETTWRPVCSACRRASARVRCRVRPKACVGPPTTTRSTSSRTASAAPTSTTSTSRVDDSPSATASAIRRVFPNIDSYTTSARISITSVTSLDLPRCDAQSRKPCCPGDIPARVMAEGAGGQGRRGAAARPGAAPAASTGRCAFPRRRSRPARGCAGPRAW